MMKAAMVPTGTLIPAELQLHNHCQSTNTYFTGRMLFLLPNQQSQSK